MIKIEGKYTKASILTDGIEKTALSQIYGFVNHPIFINPIFIMPDVHAAKGAVIGFTMEMTTKLIPNIVGVDINCGMLSVKFDGKIESGIHANTLEKLDSLIRDRIPFGANIHKKSKKSVKKNFKNFPWLLVKSKANNFANKYKDKFHIPINVPEYNEKWFENKCQEIGLSSEYAKLSLGTLGGGNHFIEAGYDNDNKLWVTIHSGSRKFGKEVCEYWQKRAYSYQKELRYDILKEKIVELKTQYTGFDLQEAITNVKKDLNINTNFSKELSFLNEKDSRKYLMDMIFTSVYAEYNRKIMMEVIKGILGLPVLETIETPHNYINFNDFIIRKGAIAAYKGEKLVIPFNMRDGLIVGEGLSNPDWNYSAPHGAGRKLSRSRAKQELSLSEFEKQMSGIYSTSINKSTLDEAPNVYKNTEEIKNLISDNTVKIIQHIKPILNLKNSINKVE